MTQWWNKWRDAWRGYDVFNRIIVVNVILFITVSIFSFLGLKTSFDLRNWLALPVNLSDLWYQPWSLLTYGFVHFDLWHLFFNMLVFYYLIQFYQNLVNPRLTLNIYLMGILAGAVSFVGLSYLARLQGLSFGGGPLLGASAGVRALLLFLAVYVSAYRVRILMFNIEMKYIGIVAVIIDFLGLLGPNVGGNLAHLGGDVLGATYAFQLQKGTDIGKGFEQMMTTIVGWFKKTNQGGFKNVYKQTPNKTFGGHSKDEFKDFNRQKQIDLILDKISKSGYESLTQEEKDFLFRAGK